MYKKQQNPTTCLAGIDDVNYNSLLLFFFFTRYSVSRKHRQKVCVSMLQRVYKSAREEKLKELDTLPCKTSWRGIYCLLFECIRERIGSNCPL
jgi:hypothetical protein